MGTAIRELALLSDDIPYFGDCLRRLLGYTNLVVVQVLSGRSPRAYWMVLVLGARFGVDVDHQSAHCCRSRGADGRDCRIHFGFTALAVVGTLLAQIETRKECLL